MFSSSDLSQSLMVLLFPLLLCLFSRVLSLIASRVVIPIYHAGKILEGVWARQAKYWLWRTAKYEETGRTEP